MTETYYAEYKAVKKLGLSVNQKQLRVQKKQLVTFERPSKLNNMPMALNASFSLGAYSYLRGGIIKALKSVGRYTSIGANVTIGENEHPTDWFSTSPAFYFADQFVMTKKERQRGATRAAWANEDARAAWADEEKPFVNDPVVIGNDVWIGANVIIRRGVKIEDGAIVGAGSIVLADVAAYDIVAGVPAKPIRRRFPDEGVISALVDSRWWEFDANDLIGLPFRHPQLAVEQALERERCGEIERRPPSYKKVWISKEGFELKFKKPDVISQAA